MKRPLLLAFVALGTSVASADAPVITAKPIPADELPPQPQPGHVSDWVPPPPSVWIGLHAELSPFGQITFSDTLLDGNDTENTQIAYGGGLDLELDASPNLAIALAPRALFNIVENGSMDPSQWLLDLRLKLMFGARLGDKARVYGYLSPGWAFIFGDKDPTTGDGVTYNGFTFGFGAGASIDLTRQLRTYIEAGYELGFENNNTADEGIGEHLNLLTVALGVQFGA